MVVKIENRFLLLETDITIFLEQFSILWSKKKKKNLKT